jgi:hypothetical protein
VTRSVEDFTSSARSQTRLTEEDAMIFYTRLGTAAALATQREWLSPETEADLVLNFIESGQHPSTTPRVLASHGLDRVVSP